MAVTGAHGITIDPFRFELRPAASFNRVIRTEHKGSAGDESPRQQSEQQMSGFQARPDSTIENTVVVLDVRVPTQSHDA